VIGLREGLETVVILGAIALFLDHQGRRDQLRTVWIASGAAAGLCAVIAVTLRVVEVNVSAIADDRLEAVIGAVAVLTVTYMVIWMRRFPKDLVLDSGASAARRLAGGSGRALAAMAFFAVLREGFEVSVFVLALIGTKASDPLLGTVGAVAGVLVAIVVGVAVVRGALHLDTSRFFRVTAFILVLSAAGLAMTAVHAANAAGWLVFGQTPQFDWSGFAPPGSVLSSVVTGMFGIQPYPVPIDVAVWLAYLIPMLLVVVWPSRPSTASSPESRAKRRRVALVLSAYAVAFAAVTTTVLVSRISAVSATADPSSSPASMPVPTQGLSDGSYLLFRSTTHDDNYGRLALVAADDPTGPRAMTSLSCDRVDFEGQVGLCLNRPTSGLLIQTSATVFNAHFKVLHQVALTGLPSRARVSPDGRYGSVTTFVTGDSYAAAGTYSTRTDIIDMQTGTVLFDLSQLAVTRDGKPFSSTDFNFWGVTFANDGRHFYATLGTGGQTYLIEGDLTTRRATVIASNVECPSLSPDNTRIAFKQRLPGPGVAWRLSVLDLATLQVRHLAETRSVDDQVEWLNNTTVLYGVLADPSIAALNPLSPSTPSIANGAPLVTDTWSIPADGSGTPRLFTSGAWSEVVTNR
jgi:high-affinity iron transporter